MSISAIAFFPQIQTFFNFTWKQYQLYLNSLYKASSSKIHFLENAVIVNKENLYCAGLYKECICYSSRPGISLYRDIRIASLGSF